MRDSHEHAFGKRPAEELYDLGKDPDQITNVAADPAYAGAKSELSAQLMRKLTEAGDPRVTGDRMTFEQPPFTTADPDQPPAQKGKKSGKGK